MSIPDQQVIADARRMTGEAEDSAYIPSDPREFSNRIFHTCYMGTENSSVETRKRAKQLSEAIGRFVTSTRSQLCLTLDPVIILT
jgi:NAD+ synthase (glutamine-hydrolysing)